MFHITDGGLHGLEAAPEDHISTAGWGCNGTAIIGADGTAVGTGAQNTAEIPTGCETPGIAADVADKYTLNGFTDWFLPSKDELNLLYQQKVIVGGFADDNYWSSSESSANSSNTAWYQDFLDGIQSPTSKGVPLRVRAVRAFN